MQDEALEHADVWTVLDLITAEFRTNPQAGLAFDDRLVRRATALAASHHPLERAAEFPPGGSSPTRRHLIAAMVQDATGFRLHLEGWEADSPDQAGAEFLARQVARRITVHHFVVITNAGAVTIHKMAPPRPPLIHVPPGVM